MGWSVTTDPVRAEEAIAWFLGKVPLSEGAFARLKDNAHRRAFMVSGLAALDLVVDVHESLGQSLSEGTTFEQWKKEIGPRIIEAWRGTVANPAHRLDTIYRTNVQSAYSTGRYHQLTDPSVLKYREFWTLDTVADDRRSDICNDLAASFEGKWLAASDPWWQDGHIPPFHFSCRTGIRSARRSVAEKDGILSDPPNVAPQQGFGATPGADEQRALKGREQKKLERAEKADPKLAEAYKEKAKEARNEAHDPAHWEPGYRARGFGEASSALAWGEAMRERGLDMSSKDARDALSGLDDYITLRSSRVLAGNAIGKAPSLRELLEKEKDPKRRSHIECAAALAGHIDSMRGKTPKRLDIVADVESAPNPEDARLQFKRFRALVTKMYSKELDFGSPDVAFWKDRGEFEPFANAAKIDASQPGCLEHEVWHGIEYKNWRVLKRSLDFRTARTKGEKWQKLKELRPKLAYEQWEITKADKFRDPYAGKEYVHRGEEYASEIGTMGVQEMVIGARDFHWDDPEYFHFMLGQMADAGGPR